MLTGWWRFAIRALTALTTRTDVDACDRAVEAMARDSRAGSALHRASVVSRAAWNSSAIRASASAVVSGMMPSDQAARWRVAGWMLAVAGATALLLNRLATIPAEPLAWIVPAALIAGGVFVMAAAGPLSRAAADRHLRHKVS